MATPCLLLLSKVSDVLARPSRAQQYRALIAKRQDGLVRSSKRPTRATTEKSSATRSASTEITLARETGS